MDIQNNTLSILYLNPVTNSEISRSYINLDKVENNDILFSFNEYTKVKLILSSENKNSYIKTLNLYNGEYIETLCDNIVEISSGAENKKYLPPGTYPIFINLGFKKINMEFRVIPNILETEDYTKILDYLEEKESGITKVNKIHKENKINIFNSEKTNKYCNLDYLVKNEKKIVNAINLVINNPIYIENDIYSKVNVNRLNKRSINNMLKRGIDNIGCTTLYKDNIEDNINNIYNENIRFIINDIYNLLSENKKTIKGQIETIENKLIEKEEELLNLRRKLETAIENIYLSENAKTNKKTNFMLSKTYIKKKKNKVDKLKEIYAHLDNFERYIKNRVNNSWLKDIKPNSNLDGKFKNNYYSNLYQIYKNLYILDNNLSVTKPTSLIYENYSLLKIIEVLDNLGFKLTNYDNIKSNSNVYLKKDNYHIVLDIEKEVLKELEDENKSQFISINSKHCTPDIKLTLYKDDKIIKSIIFEVKCRKQKYLYSNEGDTTVIEQLKDYLSFSYYDSTTKKLNKDIIEEVILLYPMQNIEYEYNSFLNISFCQLGELKDTDLSIKIENFLNKNCI